MLGRTAAELVLIKADSIHTIAKIPGSPSFEEAASLPASAHTVVQSLVRIDNEMPGGLKGKTVLIPAGLGGVGSLALQLLNPVFGAGKVITTVSTAKVPLVSQTLGEGLVDQIIDYTKQDVITEVLKDSPVDFLLDTAMLSMTYLPLMKSGSSVILSLKGKSGDTLAKDWPQLPWLVKVLMNGVDALTKWRAARWGVRYEHAHTQFTPEDVKRIEQWVVEGKLRAVVGESAQMGDLEAVRRMFDVVATGKGAVGKYVVVM